MRGIPPPSYTSIGAPETSETAFTHPPPPPSYEQVVGIRYLDRELPFITVNNNNANIWGYRPQPAYCLHCNAMVLTKIQSEYCFITHISAVLSCIFMCWPCMVCPYILPIFKKVNHRCPACNTFLGLYRPISSQE